MYTQKVIFCLGFLSLTLAAPHYEVEEHKEHHAPANYKYEYSVHDPHTGDIKEAKESRLGDHVKGFYALKEADGTTREVHYTADKHHGFNAHVSSIGKPHHPVEHHKPQVHSSGHQEPAPEHKFHIVHDKHHAKSHQSVSQEKH